MRRPEQQVEPSTKFETEEDIACVGGQLGAKIQDEVGFAALLHGIKERRRHPDQKGRTVFFLELEHSGRPVLVAPMVVQSKNAVRAERDIAPTKGFFRLLEVFERRPDGLVQRRRDSKGSLRGIHGEYQKSGNVQQGSSLASSATTWREMSRTSFCQPGVKHSRAKNANKWKETIMRGQHAQKTVCF